MNILPLVRIGFYSGIGKRFDKCFSCELDQKSAWIALLRAARWVKAHNRSIKSVNRYYIEAVNGTWSSAHPVATAVVQPHPNAHLAEKGTKNG